jgi:transcriptional regulator with XRE-family HTH domain
MDFAKRLQDALNDKGWTQSELARRMAPLLKESRIGRDNISKYVRGKVLPLPPALEAMAKVLGVESKDLLPTRATSTVSEELAPSSLRDIGGDRYWVQLNLALDADVRWRSCASCGRAPRRGTANRPVRDIPWTEKRT